jgi:hypothetical protein
MSDDGLPHNAAGWFAADAGPGAIQQAPVSSLAISLAILQNRANIGR